MNKIWQTRVFPEKGNCFSACVASILELPIESVPDFDNDIKDDDSWLEKWQIWLRERGLQFLCLKHNVEYEPYTMGYAIVSKSNAGYSDNGHAFIVYEGKPFFDPKTGKSNLLDTWDYWYILIPLNPAWWR
jgi:hypothetical protein